MQEDLGDLEGGEVRQAELDELALLVQLIALLQRLRERQAAVGGVQVEDVDAVGAQLFQRLVELLLDHGGRVRAGLVGVPFRRAGEAALLPLGLAREGFLLAVDVDAGGVDFVVAGGLEAVEDFVVGVEAGDTGAGVGVGTGQRDVSAGGMS